MLSDYVKSLSDSDQLRYAEKLTLKSRNGSVTVLADPYLIEPSEWSEDLSLWPDVQYGNIYNYLIESRGEYTAACLKHYRSLDAYNYVLAGKVFIYYPSINICIIKNIMKHFILTVCS